MPEAPHPQPRPLSFWGWGYADKFPGVWKRRLLATQLRAVLGFAAGKPRRPPELSRVRLSPSRIEPPATLGHVCSGDPEDRIRHTYGRSYRDLVRGFHGDFGSAPDQVAFPESEADVARILDWASTERVAVIPFGGGTSVVGGVEADVGEGFAGVLSLDLRRLDRVLEVDSTSRAARIQAGSAGPVLESQLAEHGMTLRHFPQSFEFSTLGGWIATRAGGHFATLYTHIDDLVESIRTLTPSGVFASRRLPASGAGPSPDRLMLGSEGALGVITEAWMRVRPRPRYKSRASLRFDDWHAAVEATREIAQSGLHPSNCRLLDGREAKLNRVATDGSSVLLLGCESADLDVASTLEQLIEIARGHGGRCPDGPRHLRQEDGDRRGDAGTWRKAFFDGPYLQSSLVSLGVVADTFETCCTWDRFPALHEAVVGEVREAMKRVCGVGMISCRFTHVYPDGPAPYYTFLAPGEEGREIDQWMEIKRAAFDAILDRGGTITHHHAVGRLHRPWYERQQPDRFGDVLGAVKRQLDPVGILNPGVLIPPTV